MLWAGAIRTRDVWRGGLRFGLITGVMQSLVGLGQGRWTPVGARRVTTLVMVCLTLIGTVLTAADGHMRQALHEFAGRMN